MQNKTLRCTFFIALVLLCILLCTQQVESKCHTVQQGAHYDDELIKGFRTTATIQTSIQFQQNMAEYIFGPQDAKGHLCQSSWNKLYGASRCGFWHGPHSDSDRFVWRRDLACFKFNGSYVVEQLPNCHGIQIAAYAYDDGQEPFKHEGTLLKQFATILQPMQWYKYVIQFEASSTIYQLFANNGTTLLEQQNIKHRECSMYTMGANLGLYFGGQCPAPSAVTACYD